MSMLSRLANTGGAVAKTYVDDVFSTYLYTGTGATQTITNGIDLAGKGGMVWIKSRSGPFPNSDHAQHDTLRGPTKMLSSNTTNAESTLGGSVFQSFNSNGFTVGSSANSFNYPDNTFVSWTFRKAPKFFDCGTYTGNGSTKVLSHSLATTVGFLIIKRTDSAGDWIVWARNSAGNFAIFDTGGRGLNAPYAALNPDYDGFNYAFTSSTIDVGSGGIGAFGTTNISGASYVAYLFAHDPSADGIIQCGSVSCASGGVGNVTLPWEPQFVLLKSATSTSAWTMHDGMRGMPVSGTNQVLTANTNAAEYADTGSTEACVTVNATGFKVNASHYDTYTYLAIRRPNKPPTLGTQVYNAIARTGTGAAATVTGVGFAPDLAIIKGRDVVGSNGFGTTLDRLRGSAATLFTEQTQPEVSATGRCKFDVSMDGVGLNNLDASTNASGEKYANWFFKRAPGFFDVVTGTGTGNVSHSLGQVPGMVIFKKTNGTGDWYVCHTSVNGYAKLNLTDAYTGSGNSITVWAGATSSVISAANFMGASDQWVAYLFATLAGISKAFSYTGNGSSQTINCGFSTGARFVLIKRTDSTGDWYVWDSTRGIVAANDPHLSLNTTAAEVTTDDSVDTDSTGFIVNQVAATNVNVNAATYIGLAIA